MKKYLFIVIAVCVFSVSLKAQSLDVKELKPSELSALEAARKKAKESQDALARLETEIKKSYGEEQEMFSTPAVCIQSKTSVALEGRYALIRIYTWDACRGLLK